MKLVKIKPYTNGVRHQKNLKKSLLAKLSIVKQKTFIQRRHGRCFKTGRITSRHKGSGCKKLFRDIKSFNDSFFSIIIAISYDPYRGSFISLNFDLETHALFYNLATENVPVGSLIESNLNKLKEYKLGFRTSLRNIPPGSLISNVCISDKKRSSIAKAAGSFNQLLHCSSTEASLRLSSGKVISVSSSSSATIGATSNTVKNSVILGKAGRSRLLGKRPKVRGVAMNPVDHPHGGRTNGGRPSVTPWGLPTKCKFYLRKKK